MTRRLLCSVALLTLGAFSPLRAQTSPSTQDTQGNPGYQQDQGTTGSQDQGTTGSQDQQGTMGSQQSSQNISEADRNFARQAYQDNLAEISAGQLATQKASSNDVKQFAQQLVDDHTQANSQLKQIASSKGIDLPTDVSSTAKSQQDSLSQASGSDFDQKFMDQQRKDHQKAIALFQQEASQGQDPELKSYASNNLSKLQQHASMADHMSNAGGSQTASNDNSGGQGKYGPENAYGPGTTSSYPSSTTNPDQNGGQSSASSSSSSSAVPGSSSSSSSNSPSTSTTTAPDQSATSSSSSSSDQTGSQPGQSNVSTQPDQTGSQQNNPDQTGTSSSSSQSSNQSSSSTSTTTDQSTSQNRALPRTASNLPLFGLAGLLLIGAGLVMRSFRMVRDNS